MTPVGELLTELKEVKKRILDLQKEENRLYNELLQEMDTIFMNQLTSSVIDKTKD